MAYNPNSFANDLPSGARYRRVIQASATAIDPDLRAPWFLVTESGNYTIRLTKEAQAVSTPLVQGVVYAMWLSHFTAGPSGAARIHLLYPDEA